MGVIDRRVHRTSCPDWLDVSGFITQFSSHFPHLIAIFPYNVSATSLGGVLLLRHL